MYWYAPHGLQVLASPAHGLLAWTPLAALSIAGLILLASDRQKDARRVGICALAMVAFQAYIAGSVESWTVAGAFGQRRFVALTILLVIGLAASWRAAARFGGARPDRLRQGYGESAEASRERGSPPATETELPRPCISSRRAKELVKKSPRRPVV
jgi:hypothetical protein